MKALFDSASGCACIILALTLIISVMLGTTYFIGLLIGDFTAACVAGVVFMIGLATPIFYNVFRYWMLLAGNSHEAPLTVEEQIKAKQQLKFYLLKTSLMVLVILGWTTFGPAMPEFKVNNRLLTGVIGFPTGILGIMIGYYSLRWTMQIKLVSKDSNATDVE